MGLVRAFYGYDRGKLFMGRYDKMLVVHIFGGSVIAKSPSGTHLEVDNSPLGYLRLIKAIDFSKFEFFVVGNFIRNFYMGYNIKEFHKELKIRLGIG